MSHLESWECLACGEIIVQPDSVLAHNERKHMADVVAAVNTRATPEQRAHIERNYRRAASKCDGDHGEPACFDEQCHLKGQPDYAYVLARRTGEQVELLCAHCALPLNAEPITTCGGEDDPATIWHLACAKEHAELKS